MRTGSRRGMTALARGLLACWLAGSVAASAASAQDVALLMTPAQEKQLGASEHPKMLQQFGGVYD